RRHTRFSRDWSSDVCSSDLYKVKDISLAPQGEKKIRWVQEHMPVLERIKKEFIEEKPFRGITVASCLHLEPKTINLGLTLMAGEIGRASCKERASEAGDATS